MVICNSSPFVSLAAVDHLWVLERLYGRLYVPEAVYIEVALAGDGRPGSAEMKTAIWVERLAVQDEDASIWVEAGLDRGKAEVIALALNVSARLGLLDDRAARREAGRAGLPVAGTVGVLVAAKDAGLITALLPVLESLIARVPFRLHPELREQVLRSVGEWP
jgi:hypothetical protein